MFKYIVVMVMTKNTFWKRVTIGQVGQLIRLQDNLYFLTAPFSTMHSQFVHSSTIIRSPA